MIEQSLFIALSVCGIWAMSWDGMIFGFVGNWIKSHAPEWLYKPTVGCIICMVPWSGSVVYLLKYGLDENIFFVLLMAMGINTVIVKFLPENWYNKEE